MSKEIIDSIKCEWLAHYYDHTKWMIVETPQGYEVHKHSKDSVAPIFTYGNKRLAAARILQLLGIGPVAPQSHPEVVGIRDITRDTAEG